RCEPPKRERLLEQLLPAALTSEQAAVKAALIGGAPGVRAFSAEVWRNHAGTRLLTLRAFVPQDSTPAQQQLQQTLSSSSKCRVLETRPLPNLNLLASTCLEIISAYTESQLPQDFLPIVCNRPADFVRQLQQANQNGMHDSIDKIIIVPCLHAAMSQAVSDALAETPACQAILRRCRSRRCSRRRGHYGRRQILRANRRLAKDDDARRPKKADVNCNDLLDDQEAPTATDGEGNDAAVGTVATDCAMDADGDVEAAQDVNEEEDQDQEEEDFDDESGWESALDALQRLVDDTSVTKPQSPPPPPSGCTDPELRSARELAAALVRFRDHLGRLFSASSGSLGQALPVVRDLPAVLRQPATSSTASPSSHADAAVDPAVEALAEAAGERVLAAYRSPDKVWRLAQLAAFLQPRLPLPAETDRKSAVAQLVEKQLAEEAGHISRRKRNSLVVQQNLDQARKSVEDEARRYESLLEQAGASGSAAQWWSSSADRLPTLSGEARLLLHIPACCLHAQSPLGLAEFAAKRAHLPETELNALLALHQSLA
ncbi:hypothetical protein BOX15_Mlig000368g3, partial [Macrostomum lignano]